MLKLKWREWREKESMCSLIELKLEMTINRFVGIYIILRLIFGSYTSENAFSQNFGDEN